MKRLLRWISFAAAAGLAAVASAQPAPTPQSSAPRTIPPSSAKPRADPGKDENQVICKSRQVTGSRLPVAKICHTRQEWESQEIETHREVERLQVGRSVCPAGIPC